MQQRLNKIGLVALLFLVGIISASPVFAGEYSYIYKFAEPKIITLSSGRQILEMGGTWQKDSIIGAPILPAKTSKMFVPATEKVLSIEIGYGTLKTIEGSYVLQHGTTPYPISHKGPIIVDKPNPNIYKKRGSYPTAVHKPRKPQFLHGVQIVLVDLMPVLYNPVEGQLKYYEELEVTIMTQKRKKPDGVMPFRNSPSNRRRILRTIENSDDFLKLQPSSGAGETVAASSAAEGSAPVQGTEYVVITTEELWTAAQTLTAHRQSPSGGGYTTYIENIADIDNNANYDEFDFAGKVRKFIDDLYRNLAYDVQYVLLLGDVESIPTRLAYANVGRPPNLVPSDLYFGCLDGTWDADSDGIYGEPEDDVDWYSEVYVGRISAGDPTEAMNQINKIIAFETGTDYPNNTLLVGEKLDEASYGGDRLDWIYTFFDSTPSTTLYDRDWIWPSLYIRDRINSNEHQWINHIGHSSVGSNMKLWGSDAVNMSNSKYFFLYSEGCDSGDFTYGDCFGEYVTSMYETGGAFAFIGNSGEGWYFSGSYEGGSPRAHKEFVEAIFTDGITKLGEANQISKTDLDLGASIYRWIAFETNLLGCPATDIRIHVSPDCDKDEVCESGEDCDTCPSDCISNPGGTCGACFKGKCDGSCNLRKEGLDCADCSVSCCCGDGVCEGNENVDNCAIDCEDPSATESDCSNEIDDDGDELVDCDDPDCDGDANCADCGDGKCEGNETSESCAVDCFCGNSSCEPGEDTCSCAADCGSHPSTEELCSDGLNNDCDEFTDCDDSDCEFDSACSSSCAPKGGACSTNSDCCSNKCAGIKCK